jgi:4-amino-4-deoxy-L-arabinose transferase-like glycosyltransferase
MDKRLDVRHGHNWATAILAATALLMTLPSLRGWCLFSPDCFQYLGIARHLLETGRFPPERLMAPPGYPLLLVPLLLLGDLPIMGLRLMLAACWAVSAAATYRLHRDELGHRLSLIAGLSVATSPVLLQLSLAPLSEMPYLALLTPTLVIISAWWRGRARSWWAVGAGGLLTAAALMVRSMGLVLVLAGLYAMLFRRGESLKRRAAIAGLFLLCSMGPAALWSWRQSCYSEGGTYAQSWTQARSAESTSATGASLQLERLTRFGPMRLEAVKEAVLPKQLGWRLFHPPLDGPTTWLIGGLFTVVALVRLGVGRSPVDLYVLGSLLLVSFWPYDEGVRLVTPILPVIIAYPLWVGAAWWRGARRKTAVRASLATALVGWLTIQCAGTCLLQSHLPNQRTRAEGRSEDMNAIASWRASHGSPGTPWLGLTEDGDNSKLVQFGAAYLARCPINPVDVQDGVIEAGPPEEPIAFVQESLAGASTAAWGRKPVEHVRGFAVYIADGTGSQ